MPRNAEFTTGDGGAVQEKTARSPNDAGQRRQASCGGTICPFRRARIDVHQLLTRRMKLPEILPPLGKSVRPGKATIPTGTTKSPCPDG